MTEFEWRVAAASILGCLGLLAVVVELVRRNKIRERYAILWLATSLVLLVLSLKRSWLETISHLMGIHYPPTALFLLLMAFVLLILIDYSIALTKQLAQIQKLSQEHGLLERRVRELEQIKHV